MDECISGDDGGCGKDGESDQPQNRFPCEAENRDDDADRKQCRADGGEPGQENAGSSALGILGGRQTNHERESVDRKIVGKDAERDHQGDGEQDERHGSLHMISWGSRQAACRYALPATTLLFRFCKNVLSDDENGLASSDRHEVAP